MPGIEAVSFDFFETLVHHRRRRGRGAELMEYLKTNGLQSAPWEHSVLYDVFGIHGHDFDPRASPDRHREFCNGVARTVFERMSVRADPVAHATALWEILGPDAFTVYDDAVDAMTAAKARGLRVIILSNWQCGLRRFCERLGLDSFAEHIVVSQEVGYEKPAPEIFAIACDRLGVRPDRVLHVGDTLIEDYQGARDAGLRALLLRRTPPPSGETEPTVETIADLRAIASRL